VRAKNLQNDQLNRYRADPLNPGDDVDSVFTEISLTLIARGR
jgi:hypothetical protein